ncbi:hypothetical protein N9137_02155 [Pseudomonadales bacterium]|nr:hypothetical protein [Pseudomonadales bacterium]
MKNVILSGFVPNKLVLSGNNLLKTTVLTVEEATNWVVKNSPKNYCGHDTTRIVGIEPSQSREFCNDWDAALTFKPKGRLEYGKEYSVSEILEIGITIILFEMVDMRHVNYSI